jgi:Ca2+-binding RTX toxin-like protein
VYGGAGDDRLSGSPSDDVLLGGDGDDLLFGGNGRDLLIGGNGADRLVGNSDDDILIAGTTDYDAAEAALCQIMDEWTRTDEGFITRVLHLRGVADEHVGTGHNGGNFLNDETVHDDGREDLLVGNSGSDWFFFNKDGDGDHRKKDTVAEMSLLEALFATDIDFIDEG